LVLSACDERETAAKPSETVAEVVKQTALEHALKHTDPTYVCPMHPEVVRHEPGNCPICGMDLVAVESQGSAPGGERKPLYYRHPHNPNVIADEPMKDEMGMDYVPVYEDSGGVPVQISPRVRQNMGVRTAEVEKTELRRRINTVGYVDFDETRLSHIHLRTDGWIERLAVKSEGERVSRGDVLFELYSPTLVNAQEEYLQALSGSSRALVAASRERLVALGVSGGQIKTLANTRRVQQMLNIYAPQNGIVASLNVREGMFVKPATEVMMLADLSSVWLLAEVFESQADWVRLGAPAKVRLSYLPGREWAGDVEYIYPSLDRTTRTLKVRLRFDNPEEELKPNMFADVTIQGGAKREVVVIPREALIRTGEEERVILDMGEGSFQPRKVVAGIEVGNWVEIREGLREGDTVVTSGQFLIDSEASLQASVRRMGEPASSVSVRTETVTGTGVLKALLPEEHRVNMHHDPIEAIGWSAMTMDFRIKEGVNLEGLRPEDSVMFQLEQTTNGYVISSIHKHER
jgi:Cu(I)/Ag(I) efflux system membrane fusion protein